MLPGYARSRHRLHPTQGLVCKARVNYTFSDLTEEEVSIIVSSLFRELHLISGRKHYKASAIKSVIQKLQNQKDRNEPDGPRFRSKLD